MASRNSKSVKEVVRLIQSIGYVGKVQALGDIGVVARVRDARDVRAATDRIFRALLDRGVAINTPAEYGGLREVSAVYDPVHQKSRIRVTHIYDSDLSPEPAQPEKPRDPAPAYFCRMCGDAKALPRCPGPWVIRLATPCMTCEGSLAPGLLGKGRWVTVDEIQKKHPQYAPLEADAASGS